MDLKSGYPLWPVRFGMLFDCPQPEHDFKTKALVPGGGISGAPILSGNLP